ncbi:hypothetical protein [Actinoplanes sp. NPDC049316]|uniref:hypothetical protein n=1 Tax=Actinoplanes sp. NPDC049316 TaxID=3154727 RepID=UPI0034191357
MGELTRRDKQVVGGMVALLVASGGALVLSGESAETGGTATAPPERTVIAGAETEMGPARLPVPGRPAGSAQEGAAEAPSEIRTLSPWPGLPAATGTATGATGSRTTAPGVTPQRVPSPPPLVRPPLPTPTTPARPTTPATSKPVPATKPPARPHTRPPVSRPPATRPPVTTPPATTPPTTTPPVTTPPAEPATPPVTEAPQEPSEPEPAKSEPQDQGGEDHDHDFPWEPGEGGLPDPGSLTWPPSVPPGNPFG